MRWDPWLITGPLSLTPLTVWPLAGLLLDEIRSLVNHWSPLTHTSHCVTTSWPAAARQTRVRVSPAMQPMMFSCRMLFHSNVLYFQAGNQLSISWLAYPKVRLIIILFTHWTVFMIMGLDQTYHAHQFIFSFLFCYIFCSFRVVD